MADQNSPDDVRGRLQQAALELFRERGYERTTAAQIAARVGVTERTFFRYFPDKRETLFGGEALPAELYYRSFIREVEDEERLAFYLPSTWPVATEPLPPHSTVEAMIRFDPEFRDAYKRAERRFRIMDGHRAGYAELDFDTISQSEAAEASGLLRWAAPVASRVVHDTASWDTWRPWSTLLDALEDYLQYDNTGFNGCVVYA